MVSGLLAPPGEVFRIPWVQEFSLGLAMAWVDRACGGFFDKERACTLKPTDVYLFRVAAMLDVSRSVGRCCAAIRVPWAS